MRRKLVCALTTVCVLLLCGCADGSSRGREAFEDFRESYVSQNFTCTADITANIGGSVFECRVEFQKDANGESVTVLEPLEISGITARMDKEKTTIEYEGVILDVGGAEDSGLTPVSAMFAVDRAWREAVFQEASRTEFNNTDCWQVAFSPYDTSAGSVTQTLIFTKDDCRPVLAELFCGGERMITVEYIYQ
ncbi:MAG: hypothetical protein IJP23_02610 [Oscillospiraceae bacterium]|nr:hypothetical protein [Oscillospiraceae bacterium]